MDKVASDMFNALPKDQRKILHGMILQRQILDYHVEKQRAQTAHRKHIKEINDHLKNVEQAYELWKKDQTNDQ